MSTASDTSTNQASLHAVNVAASVGRSTLFGFLNNLVQVATRLVTVPIVIHHLGLGGYGIWNIIMMTATYMRFGSVGVKTAFQKYVAEATGTGNYDRAATLLSTGCAVMVVLSLVVLIPASFLSRYIAHTAGVPPEFMDSAAGAISLLALIMMMSNVGATFEAIVMGGHRIDLVRKFSTVCTTAEAIAIVTLLHFGFGLFAMAAVMGISELLYIGACYLASLRVVPQIRVHPQHVTTSVLYELFRFAGSYQLVNYLEVLYASIVPFAVLRAFGADAAGVYAVVTRVVSSASVLLDAFVPPILSAGTLVYVSGSVERMKRLLVKAFKVTFGLSFLPMGFAAVFGPLLAYVWTGSSDPRFPIAFWMVSAMTVFRAVSVLALVLYRVSGKAMLDNVRQVLRIILILIVVAFASRLNFNGVLAGLAFAEFAGMTFMIFALTRTFRVFSAKLILPDAFRLFFGSTLILLTGVVASYAPVPGHFTGRAYDTVKLVEIGIAAAVVAWPALHGTGSVTSEEGHALFGAVMSRTRNTPVLSPQEAESTVC